MIAVDTNILVRVIVRDDPDQADLAERVLRDGVFIPVTVLLETAWVLAFSYTIARSALADSLLAILAMPATRVANEPMVRWALQRYRDDRADIADLLHLTQCGHADAFVTFDRRLARQAGAKAPATVRTLP